MFNSWEEQLKEFVLSCKWKEILSLATTIPIEEKSRYLWAWPSESCLRILKDLLDSIGVSRILSIGCGSGLLEWIIHQSTGASVSGVELDNSWWKSSYAPKTLIDLSYADNCGITSDFLLDACKSDDWNFALLFCYFNNHDAFVRYLDAYHGKYLFIVGPSNECGRHSDPKPFEPNFNTEHSWKCINSCDLGNGEDFIACYVNSRQKSEGVSTANSTKVNSFMLINKS